MSIRSFFLLHMFVALSLVPLGVAAGEVPFPQCPKKLPIKQIVETSAEDGWKIVNSIDTSKLEHIGISYGEYPIHQTGFNISTEEKLPKVGSISHYLTISTTAGRHDYWAVCTYIESAVVLVQKIPENTVRCEVKYINDVTVPDRVTIKCFDTPREEK